jgi:hypothetical protein
MLVVKCEGNKEEILNAQNRGEFDTTVVCIRGKFFVVVLTVDIPRVLNVHFLEKLTFVLQVVWHSLE